MKKLFKSSKKSKAQTIGLVIVAMSLSGLAFVWKRYRDQKPENSPALQASSYRELIPYIEAQAKHETGNYTSRVFLLLNNPYGMKVPTKRKFLGQPSNIVVGGIPYAKYSSLEMAHKDFLEWLKFTKFPKSVSSVYEYAGALKQRKYYEDSYFNYARALEKWMN